MKKYKAEYNFAKKEAVASPVRELNETVAAAVEEEKDPLQESKFDQSMQH